MRRPARILLATDAWHPQVNGVVRTLSHVKDELQRGGDTVHVVSPEGRRSFGLPTYKEIRLAFPSARTIAREVEDFGPNAIHIATEGPVGIAVRRHCLRHGLPFTTGYHTRFPEFAAARAPRLAKPATTRGFYRLMKMFHAPSSCVLTPTQSIADDLTARGFRKVRAWTRGVDHAVFRDIPENERVAYEGEPPFLINCGRIAVEKNVEAFLNADVPGTKIVIGDGPARGALEKRHPQARFLGYRFGEDLARHLAGGDAFVFPSKTDTFGLVMIEAMACGLPVAAHPVPGPIDVVEHERSGWLADDLAEAIRGALTLDRTSALERAQAFTWAETTRQLRDALVEIAPT